MKNEFFSALKIAIDYFEQNPKYALTVSVAICYGKNEFDSLSINKQQEIVQMVENAIILKKTGFKGTESSTKEK